MLDGVGAGLATGVLFSLDTLFDVDSLSRSLCFCRLLALRLLRNSTVKEELLFNTLLLSKTKVLFFFHFTKMYIYVHVFIITHFYCLFPL